MNQVMATLILVAATVLLISLAVFAADGVFGDANRQKQRSHEINKSTTVPTTLPTPTN